MQLKERMILDEICTIVNRSRISVAAKLENKYFFENIKQSKENGTRFYHGITEKNIEDLKSLFSRKAKPPKKGSIKRCAAVV